MKPRSGGKHTTARPNGHLRRSQAVTTFGPGATMDLLDQAVLVAGTDYWRYREREWIHEPRLRDSVAKRLKSLGVQLSVERPFLAPPKSDERDPSKEVGIDVLEFPQWFVCQGCRAVVASGSLEPASGGRYEHRCLETNKRSDTVPVRFVGACARGHLQDFPWIAFAHLGGERGRCVAPQLVLYEGPGGDFSEIEVRCTTCGAHQRLSTAMGGVELECGGHRPWLGAEGKESCKEKLRMLVRTASNSYFAQVESALSIPEPGKALEDAVLQHWDTLKVATAATLPVFRTIPKLGDAIAGATDAEVLALVEARKEGGELPRLPIRTAEYLQLSTAPPHRPGDLPPRDADFFARSYVPAGGLPAGVSKLVLASKLREVRAQVGFTRIAPLTADMQGSFELEVRTARLGLTTNWLPATEVHGEGIFVALDLAAVRAWEARPEVVAREKELRAGYEAWTKQQLTAPPAFPGARFYLLHSLSHLLITALSLECGYAASAIRERLYCGPSPADPGTEMAAILLSTGTSGTDGTLGGLVEQGMRIGEHLARAWDLGRLCSNDPVCARHSPEEDHAERHLEGAACHGCLFVAECSCERFNRYLDRSLVVPTVGNGGGRAYFRERPKP